MLGGFLKDIFLLKKHWFKGKFILAFLIALIIVIVFLRQNSVLISIFITMLFLNSIQSLFVDDNKYGFLEFLNTTGLPTVKIVFGRYLSAFSICLVSTVFSLVTNIIIYISFRSMPIKSYFFLSLLTLIISIAYILILLPFIYLFNQNGLTVALVLLISIVFLLSRINNFVSNISNFIIKSSYIMLGVYAISALLLLACISIIISIMVYTKHYNY